MMALSAQVMRPAPYAIPHPRIHSMHRSPYTPSFTAPSTNASAAFFQNSMLTPGLSNGIHSTTHIVGHVNSHILPSLPSSGAPHSLGLTHGGQLARRSHSTSGSNSPNSPMGVGEEHLGNQLTPCPYTPLQNGLSNGAAGASSPLSSCAPSSPFVAAAPINPHSTMLPGSAMYAQDYCPNMNISPAGSHFSSLPMWNPYPSLPVNSLPNSLPKLSYDTPRYKLTPERAIPLIKWFEEHKDHPYPSRHEKILLCQSTQLTFTQVSTWFANARRRMKKANSEEEERNSDDLSANEPESPSSVDSREESPKKYTQRKF